MDESRSPVSMNCNHCEELTSDYLEGALSQAEHDSMDLHLQSCTACSELLASMTEVLKWGKAFVVHEAPAWLPARIVANTPRLKRESWLDTLAAAWRWTVDPRAAMGVFTAMLVLGWQSRRNLAGLAHCRSQSERDLLRCARRNEPRI
jgi:predicted anti-sigma-YlaC factor YlaD